MTAPELKPCPFCGFKAALCTTDRSHPVYWVECISCNADATPSTDKEEAISAWNTRADTAAAKQQEADFISTWNAAIRAAAAVIEGQTTYCCGAEEQILALLKNEKQGDTD
jgi:Lar family restriction alleviation protein